MSVLRVVLDPMLGPDGRYAEQLVRALITTAPAGSVLAGTVAASSPEGDARIGERLPGLAELHRSALAPRQRRLAWRHGLTPLPGTALVHATDLLAPLRRHDRGTASGGQVVVTVRDARAWTHPDSLPPREVAWQRAMGRRAARWADAVVVPTHVVAEQLADALALGDRMRVIGAAPSPAVRPPADAEQRAGALGLPSRYVLAEALDPQDAAALSTALGPRTELVQLVPLGGGDEGAGEPLPAGHVSAHDDEELAVILGLASALVVPRLTDGFGMLVLQAMALGVPVVHGDDPALRELTAGAAVEVAREPGDAYGERLGAAARELLDAGDETARLSTLGRDRARAFSWRDTAEKVWQLHADL